jgi:hypothetical protein
MIWIDQKRLLLFGGFSGEKSSSPETAHFIFHLDDHSWSALQPGAIDGAFELSRAGNAVMRISDSLSVSVAGIAQQANFCTDLVTIST